MKILFYGSVEKDHQDLSSIQVCVENIVKHLIDLGATITTREGNADGENRLNGNLIPIDNIVLDTACKYRDEEGMPYESVLSFVESNEFERGNYSNHDRKMIVLPVSHRLAMYKEMISCTDLLVTVGGKEGVYRIGLFAFALDHPVFPLGFTGGTSRTLWRELISTEGIHFVTDAAKQLIGTVKFPRKHEIQILSKEIYDIATIKIDKKGKSVQCEIDNKPRWRDLMVNLSFVEVLALITILITLFIAVGGGGWKLGAAWERSIIQSDYSSQVPAPVKGSQTIP